MTLAPIKIDRTSKPPIGTPLRSDGHWSVQGLVGCWALNEGSGLPRDAISGKVATSMTAAWTPDGIQCAATYVDTGVSPSPYGGSFTFMLFGYETVYNTVLLSSCQDYNTAGYTLVSNTTGMVQARVNSSGTNVQTVEVTHSQSLRTQITGVIDRPASLLRLYLDGAERASVDISSIGSITNSYPVCIGGRNGGAPTTGKVCGVLLFNRVLSAGEIAALYGNPWQVYEPSIAWATPGGGGAFFYQSLAGSFPAPSGSAGHSLVASPAAINTGLATASVAYGSRSSTGIAKPSGTASGDLMLAALYIEALGAVTLPSGWSLIDSYGDSTLISSGMYYLYTKVDDGTAGPYVWTHASAATAGVIKRYTGVDPATPLDAAPVHATSTMSTSLTFPGITTATNGAALVLFAEDAVGASAYTGVSTPLSVAYTDGGGAGYIWLGDGIQSAAGASGSKTLTNNSTQGAMFGTLLALRPATGGRTTYNQSLAGAFPAPTGTAGSRAVVTEQLSGTLPAPSGSIAKIAGKRLSGDLPAASGMIGMRANKGLSGTMPAANGTIMQGGLFHTSLSGVMGTISGAVATVLNPVVAAAKGLVKVIGAGFKKIIGG